MKRCEILINPKDHKAIAASAKGAGSTFSEFVRQAVLEKLDREQVVSQVVQVKNELSELINEFRSEVQRTRKDLMDDNQRGIELMRQDSGRSTKKNEELFKVFVMTLNGQAPAAKPRPPARTQSDDGPPVRVRGPG